MILAGGCLDGRESRFGDATWTGAKNLDRASRQQPSFITRTITKTSNIIRYSMSITTYRIEYSGTMQWTILLRRLLAIMLNTLSRAKTSTATLGRLTKFGKKLGVVFCVLLIQLDYCYAF